MIDQSIELLDFYGVLTAALVMHKFKITLTKAEGVLSLIVNECENVKMKNSCTIYIVGRERPLEHKEIKCRKKRVRAKKPPKWKDISKPY